MGLEYRPFLEVGVLLPGKGGGGIACRNGGGGTAATRPMVLASLQVVVELKPFPVVRLLEVAGGGGITTGGASSFADSGA